jgi:nucleotide-binding universal stress UspA family protein
MIASVVVPLDGSPLAARAIRPARALTERAGASLLLMTAARDPHVRDAGKRLDDQATDLGLDRVETAVVPNSSAAEAILSEARDPNTVVCMSSHRRSGVGQVLLGSVAEAVLRRSERPVLVIGPSVDRECWQFADGKLVAAIDESTASEAIIPAVAEWGRLLGLRAWVVRVVPGAAGIEPNPDEHAAESAAVRQLAERLSDAGEAAEWKVLGGPHIATSILDYANQSRASLVVMGTHGRTGVARIGLGSVAMHVVHHCHCPVLVIRAPDEGS